MTTVYIHNEFWDERTGRDILLQAAKAAAHLIVNESIHVYTPSIMDETGASWGEADLWWSATLIDGATHTDVYQAIKYNAHIRVKEAGIVPDEYALCDARTLWDHLNATFADL
jgi:hypothetical protein